MLDLGESNDQLWLSISHLKFKVPLTYIRCANMIITVPPDAKQAQFWPQSFMMTSSMETFSTLLALCEGNPSVARGFSSQRPVMRSFDVFFDLHLNKRLSKQSRSQWFETPLRSLCRHYNVMFLSKFLFLPIRWPSLFLTICFQTSKWPMKSYHTPSVKALVNPRAVSKIWMTSPWLAAKWPLDD